MGAEPRDVCKAPTELTARVQWGWARRLSDVLPTGQRLLEVTFQKTPLLHSGPLQLSCLPRESILGANYTAGSALGERGAWGQPTRETT